MVQQVEIIQLEQGLENDRTALTHAEAAIERAARTAFIEWGAQLKHIRDSGTGGRGLYYVTGLTWEQYCDERWEITPQRAGQLISGYEMVEELKLNETLVSKTETNSFYLPVSETHIRPLKKLDTPEQRAEVWQRVIENTNGNGITAKIVEIEVQKYKDALEKNWITLSEWNELSDIQAFMSNPRLHLSINSSKTMNNQEYKDSIEWSAFSWNPVTGCLHNCPYCYARDIAMRFYPQEFEPSFLPERLFMPANTKQIEPRWDGDFGYKNVFTCSMADLFGKWTPEEWIRMTLETIANNPRWTFLLLTKFPIRMSEFNYPDNVWLGTTVDKQHTVERAEKAFIKVKESGFKGVCWLSCEPMLEKLTFSSLEMFNWVVIGGASKSTQTPEYKPPFDDIIHLYEQARKSNCRVYMKTNLMPGLNDEQRIREYPI